MPPPLIFCWAARNGPKGISYRCNVAVFFALARSIFIHEFVLDQRVHGVLLKCSQRIVLQVLSDFNRVHQTAIIIIDHVDNEKTIEDKYHRKHNENPLM